MFHCPQFYVPVATVDEIPVESEEDYIDQLGGQDSTTKGQNVYKDNTGHFSVLGSKA